MFRIGIDVGGTFTDLVSVDQQGRVTIAKVPSTLDGDDVIGAWVAHEQGEIVGHVAITRVDVDARAARRWQEVTGHQPAELAAVSQLFVRPRFRGQGVAATLVDVAVADIRGRGLVPVLEVVTVDPLAPSYARDHGWRLRASDARPGKSAGLWVHRLMAEPVTAA